ncbi:uncharacterized protein cubi_02760 [Cryptosporidium ubiquitum]|uniref:HEAT repeat-containing protein 1 n=1 Tax=Cryptosporidium ubiquitum TaxID=857276 RepID=A0A1J4MIA5_9CRYT|nr:uncharacterized protein cubi_02760 [Cryptosporidium ubiquitum]OII73958.1 hypothetical protein cubi_02760 [Cryptosporidium ubiquitum]
MSTELQKQINSQLRNNELAFLSQRALKVNRSKKERISFLFDTKTEFYARKGVTAENRIPIYEDLGRLRYLGEQGLSELESLNPRISHEAFNEFFENTDISSIQMLTAQEAGERLEKLKRFVDFLVPYFLLDSTKICIEYLIQAYDINVLLGEYLFYSFLPYHDMAEFCQLIKTLDIPESSEIKGLVDSIKATGTVITSRSHLSSILLRNSVLFKNIIVFWEKRLEIFHLTKNIALTNLITWLIIEIIEDLSRSKDLKNLHVFLENIIEIIIFGTCLKGSQYEDLRSTGYCILYKLATPLLNLSNEIQIRIIEELFKSISKNHINSSNYLPETIILMNHILTQLGTLSHLEYLDHEISQFILEKQIVFINTFKQLSNWDGEFLQILTLITKSIINFGIIQDQRFSKSCINFIESILNILGDTSSFLLMDGRQSKMVKVIILTLIDLYSQDQIQNTYFVDIIQIIHSNYPSELLSALNFSLSVSSSPNSQLFELKEKAQMFLDIVLKEEGSDLKSKEGQNSRMFLTLLNSQDPSVLNSCLDMITNLIQKSSKNFKEMTHFEKRIFDLSLKHFLGSFNNDNNQNDFNEKSALQILRQTQTIKISHLLDLENSPSQDQGHCDHQYQWRITLIFKSFLRYFRSKITTGYPTLFDFFSKEVSFGLNFKDKNGNFGIENMIMESIFSHIFGQDFEKKFMDLFTSISLIFENVDSELKNKMNDLDLILLENSDILISLFTLISHEDLSFSHDLKKISSRLISLIYNHDQIHVYFKQIFMKPNLNYLELSLILLSLKKLNSDLKSSYLLPNLSFLEFGINLNNDQQIINLLESLYYKLYYYINSLFKSKDDKKTTNNLVGTYVLTILRSIFHLVSSRENNIFDSKLLNITLVDTLDIGILSINHLGLPIFQILNNCFDPDYKIRNKKISNLVTNLSRNLFNILSQNDFYFDITNFEYDLYNSPFYGKNVYSETLISHSYSFLEIVISKLPISQDSKNNTFSVSNLLKILYSTLSYAVIPAFLGQRSMSIKMASFRLCKAIKDTLQLVNIEKVFKGINLKFSDILLDYDHSNDTGIQFNYQENNLRSCYLNKLGPKINNVLEIIDILLNHQSEIIVENRNQNLLEIIFRDNRSNNVSGTLLLLNLVMIFELIFDQEIEDIKVNLNLLSNYIRENLIYGNIYSDYHEILIEIAQSFLVKSDIDHKDKHSNSTEIIGLSFLKQGIENLLNYIDNKENIETRNNLILGYLNKIQRFENDFQYLDLIKENKLARQTFIEILLIVLDDKITRNLRNDDKFVSFIVGIISQIVYYSPENIKKISLSQYIKEKSLEKLDLLIIGLLKYCILKDNYKGLNTKIQLETDLGIGLNEQIILEWIYCDLNLVSLEILNIREKELSQDQKIEYNFNKDLVSQTLRYLEINRNRLKNFNEEMDIDILIKIEFYLIRILEFGIKFRSTQFKDLENILDYFEIKEKSNDKNVISKFMLNPMIVSSITSMFSNIQIKPKNKDTTDHSKSYFKICKVLFSIYMNLVKNTKGGIDKKNFAVKSTFYSLSLFIDYSLQNSIYFDHYSKERIKGILFKILISEQIKEIVETNRFNQINELLCFMEKLHNEVIYKEKKQRFKKSQGIFMIIKYYLSMKQNSEYTDLDILIKHLLKNKLFDTRINVYRDLLVNVENEMEILMKFEDHDQNDHGFETKKVILENLILMTKTIIYFLNKTLLNTEIKSNEIQDLLELFDRLILIKTLMNKRILKKLGTVLKGNETDLEINEKLKSRIDKLEKEYLLTSFELDRNGDNVIDNNNTDDYYINDNKGIQKEIDQLIQSIIEDDNMKKYLIVNWDLSKDPSFQVIKSLRRRFYNILLNNKMDCLGIILKECLDKNIKVSDLGSYSINKHDKKSPIIFNTIEYFLDIIVSNKDPKYLINYKMKEKDLEMLDERMETGSDSDIGSKYGSEFENEKEDLKSKLKLWIKNWYIIDLILKVFVLQGEEKYQDKFSKLIFSRIIHFYKNHENIQDGYGLIFKIPLIQNFLLEKILTLEKIEAVSILGEIQTILEDTIRTIKFLNNNANMNNINIIEKDILNDRKVKSILISMITSSYRGLDKNQNEDSVTQKALLLPYLALLSTLLNSNLGSVMMNAEIRKEILVNVLLHDQMVSYYDLSELTNLLKSERSKKLKFNSKREKNKEDKSFEYLEDLSISKQKNDNNTFKLRFYLGELDKKIRSSSQMIGYTFESYIIRILIIYCSLTSSPTSHSYDEDFIGGYSQILKEISSELFSKLNFNENIGTSNILIGQEIDIYYSKLAILVLIVSFSINFIDADKLLTEKSFIERFSQFYLLLVNLLIINFSKLHSIKETDLKIVENNSQDSEIRNNQEKLSGRKRTEEEKDNNDKYYIKNEKGGKESLYCFISSIFGKDVLLSHAFVNPNWFGLDVKDLKKLSNSLLNNSNSNIKIWRLESSISTLLSVFVLKLNAKKLRELILLIKRLIHRNGESFLSKVSSMTKKSGDSKTGNNSDKQAIRDLYGEISASESSNLVKDIYSCRIWILILLAVFESTGEYGVFCLIDDIALDVKSICDLTQMNALTCVQNITISQYRNIQSPSKRSPSHQQIANLSHLDNDFGWYWYHLGIYNLILIKMIYFYLSGQKEESKDVPSSIEDYLVNPIITNLDMFALFDPNSTRSLSGCGKQWDLILGDIWIHSIRCFRNNDLILAGIIRLLINKLRNGNEQVRMFSAEILLKIWKDEICSISILSHLSDILPTIKELLSDHSEEMINIAKSIIKNIEERTGEDISKQLY